MEPIRREDEIRLRAPSRRDAQEPQAGRVVIELRAAIAADDWPGARVPQLADLVDRLARRCPTEPAPRQRIQPWWIPRARAYDPIIATALLASASDLAHKSDVTWSVIAQTYATSPIVQRIRDAVER